MQYKFWRAALLPRLLWILWQLKYTVKQILTTEHSSCISYHALCALSRTHCQFLYKRNHLVLIACSFLQSCSPLCLIQPIFPFKGTIKVPLLESTDSVKCCKVIIYAQKNKFRMSRRIGTGRGRRMFEEETLLSTSGCWIGTMDTPSDFFILRHKLFSKSGSMLGVAACAQHVFLLLW